MLLGVMGRVMKILKPKNTDKNKKSLISTKYSIFFIILVIIFSFLILLTNPVSAAQNSNYPKPSQCAGADWNIGLPNGVSCAGSVETINPLEYDYKAKIVTGYSTRLKPDLTSLNKFCQEYTGQSQSYAIYGRIHNYCAGCNQGLTWWENNQWNFQTACAGTLNVQTITCASDCSSIICSSNSDCDGGDLYTYDKCVNPGTSQSYCTHTEINCINNNDCGFNGYFGDEFCSNNDVFKNYQESKCINPATPQSYCQTSIIPKFLIDCGENFCGNYGRNYCKGSDVYHSRLCENKGCSKGACFNKLVEEESLVEKCKKGCSSGFCNPECIQDSECDNGKSCVDNKCIMIKCFKDSDCGSDGFLNQPYCKGNNVLDSYLSYKCLNPGSETSQCTSLIKEGLIESCKSNQICFLNKCMDVKCKSNSDCNDNNPKTEDVCLYAGTSDSICIHNPINCLEDSECGSDGFINTPFCKDNDVFQDYKTFKCNNAGSSLSFCSISTILKLKNNCTENQVCSNGVCKEKTCLKNSDCGVDKFLNTPFCKNNNVFDKFISFTCNKPGQPDAYCINSTQDKIAENCTLGCSNGKCITSQCNSDSDCSKDSYSSRYCKGNDVFKDFNDFYCKEGKCNKNVSAELVEKCRYDCDSGKCERTGGNEGEVEEDPIIENESYSPFIYAYPSTISKNESIDKSIEKISLKNAQVRNIQSETIWIIFVIIMLIFLIIFIILIIGKY